jgi:hypothetical protein
MALFFIERTSIMCLSILPARLWFAAQAALIGEH